MKSSPRVQWGTRRHDSLIHTSLPRFSKHSSIGQLRLQSLLENIRFMMGFREDSKGLLLEHWAVNNFEFILINIQLLGRRQVAKTQDFDSCIRRFESSRPSHFFHSFRGREIIMGDNGRVLVFSGRSNEGLTREICDYMDIHMGNSVIKAFSDEEIFVRIEENVRGGRRICTPIHLYPRKYQPDGTAHHD